MRSFVRWLIAPDVLPLVARLLLVAATALVAGSPDVALALAAPLEAASLAGSRR